MLSMLGENPGLRGDPIRKPKRAPFDINKVPKIEWNDDRPKPELTPGIYNEESTYELERYLDWHRRHPHCVSPRRKENAPLEGVLIADEEDPKLVYTESPGKLPQIPVEFQPPRLGLDCDTDEVSTIAMKAEYKRNIAYISEYDDPWYEMSVKDQLEQSHADGSHTTVKSKRKKKPPMTAFDRNLAWQMETYGEYEGGYPEITLDHSRQLEELALQDKFYLFENAKKPAVSPWYNEYKYSKYTAEGTALEDFNKADRNKKVGNALSEYEREMQEDAETARELSAKGSSRKSKRRSAKIAPEGPTVDPDAAMRKRLGGEKAIDKMTKQWINTAIKITKKSKKGKAAIDTSIDLAEACEKLRVVKVIGLLISGKVDPNMLTPDDEPLFTHMVGTAIKYDQLSGNLHPTSDLSLQISLTRRNKPSVGTVVSTVANPDTTTANRNSAAGAAGAGKGTKSGSGSGGGSGNGNGNGAVDSSSRPISKEEDDNRTSTTSANNAKLNATAAAAIAKSANYFNSLSSFFTAPPLIPQDTPERRKVQRILDALVQYKVNVNASTRDGFTALHLAAKNDDSRFVRWLIYVNGIDLNKESKQDRMTALMIAAKYGNVKVIAELIKAGVKESTVSTGAHSYTALHYAAFFGQTRCAQFLLRVGANKKIRNADGKVAAEIAAENGFTNTAQLISAYTAPDNHKDATEQLDFLLKAETKTHDTPSHSMMSSMSRGFSLHSIHEGMRSLYGVVRKRSARMYHYVRYQLGLEEEREPIEEEEEEEEEDEQKDEVTGNQNETGNKADVLESLNRRAKEKEKAKTNPDLGSPVNDGQHSTDNSVIGEVVPF